MCATCKADLEEVNRSDNNCPIVLDKLPFNVFYNYMPTKKIENYGGCLSATSFDGVQSSLTRLYRMIGKTMERVYSVLSETNIFIPDTN